MPDRIKIGDRWYDASNAPPWYEHYTPGGLRLNRTLEEARMNARRRSGNDIENAILWCILGLFLLVLIVFIVSL